MTYQREFERRLEIAVIGVGSHCYRNILPALHYLPVRLRAICDRDLDVARRTAQEYGVMACFANTDEMYRSLHLDAVLICVGAKAHPALGLEAVEAGCHVWMEKPPSVRASDLDDLVAAQGDRTVAVGFKKVFLPALAKVRESLADPGCSPLQTMLAEYPVSIPPEGPQVLAERQETNWLANGCHPLSLLMSVGGPVAAVTTFRTRWGDGSCVLEFENGVVATLHLASGAGAPQPCERYSFFASGCSAVIDNTTRVSIKRVTPFEYGRSTTFAPPGISGGTLVWEPQHTLSTLENKAIFTDGIYGELLHFCQHALAGTPVTLSGISFARDVMAVYEAALLSSGERVTVPA